MGSKKKDRREAAIAEELARRTQTTAPSPETPATPEPPAPLPPSQESLDIRSVRIGRLKDQLRDELGTKPPTTPPQAEQPTTRPAFTLPSPPPESRRSGGTSAGDTLAMKADWDEFCDLYAVAVGKGEDHSQFYPVGFIAGPAVLIVGGQVVDACPPNFTRTLGTLPRDVAKLPEHVRDAMNQWETMVLALGYSPTPWERGAATWLLQNEDLDTPIVMGMLRFRYRSGDPELPFGAVLEPDGNGVRLARVYNPGDPERRIPPIPDVPAVGHVFSWREFKDGRGAVNKLAKAWRLAEDNYSVRFYRNGNRRPDKERNQRLQEMHERRHGPKTAYYSTGESGVNRPFERLKK